MSSCTVRLLAATCSGDADFRQGIVATRDSFRCGGTNELRRFCCLSLRGCSSDVVDDEAVGDWYRGDKRGVR